MAAKQVAPSSCKGSKEVEFRRTATSRDGPVPSEEAGHQLGQDGEAVAGIQGGEIAKEEVHGGVQMPV